MRADSAVLEPAVEAKGLLRFLTCGSVDDGKSTLIGRLLYDSRLILEDQLLAVTRDSKKHGTLGDDVDLALLVDGLEAEREQGITIDVAYRFVSTPRRAFIIADTPGHEQYTRNMATGASTCDLAIILVDARKGILTQTKRHSYICALLGVRHVVLAVNKIDLVDFDRSTFERIAGEYRAFAQTLGLAEPIAIPTSARFGDNVVSRSHRTPWYDGPALLEHLEEVDVVADQGHEALRFPVQWVNRPHHEFRGFAGTVASGSVRTGDPVIVASSGRQTSIARIVTYDGEQEEARVGDAVTLTLADEIDVARGDVLTSPASRPHVARAFVAHVLWLAEAAYDSSAQYLMRVGTAEVPARIVEVKHHVDVNTLEHQTTPTLGLNDIALCELSLQSAVAFDAYARNRRTGAFILIDRATNATVAAGMIEEPVAGRDSDAAVRRPVSRDERERRNGHRGIVVVVSTGGSASEELAATQELERRLFDEGFYTMTVSAGASSAATLAAHAGFVALCSAQSLSQGDLAALGRIDDLVELSVASGRRATTGYRIAASSLRAGAEAVSHHVALDREAE